MLSGFRISMYGWHESELVMLVQELVNISCRSRLVFSHHHRIGTKFDGQSWFCNAAPGCVIHLQPLPLLSNIFFHWLSCVYGPLWSPTAAQVVGPLLHARWTPPWDDDKLALGPTLRGSLAGLMHMALKGRNAELPLGTRVNKSASSKKIV